VCGDWTASALLVLCDSQTTTTHTVISAAVFAHEQASLQQRGAKMWFGCATPAPAAASY